MTENRLKYKKSGTSSRHVTKTLKYKKFGISSRHVTENRLKYKSSVLVVDT